MLGWDSSVLTETAPDLVVDFLLLLAGRLALEEEERFDAGGFSALRESDVNAYGADSTLKTYSSGTPPGYFSRRRRMISTFFRLALRPSL